jgi:ABC-type sugar transport system, periplasmic component
MMKKMKRIGCMIAAVLILVTSITSCSKLDKTDNEPLTIYYFNNTTFDNNIKVFTTQVPIKLKLVPFSSAEEMKKRVTTEMGAGKGPDVVLFSADDDSSIDPYKMAGNGAFYDLTSYFKKYSGRYFQGAMDACKVNGKQYFAPIGFKLPVLLTTSEMLKSQNITLSDDFTFDELAEAIIKNIKKLENDNSSITLYQHLGTLFSASSSEYPGSEKLDSSSVMYWLETMGVDVADIRNKKITLSQSDVKKAVELQKAVSNESAKVDALYTKSFVQNGTGSLFNPDFATFCMWGCNQLPGIIGIADKNQTTRYLAIPNKVNKASYTGVINLYGVVNANTKQSANAQKLLRYMMDNYKLSNGVINSLLSTPNIVNIQNYDTVLNDAIDRLPEGVEVPTAIKELINHTDKFVMPNNAVTAIVNDAFKPYMSGSQTFDVCYSEMTNKLNLYLNE